MPGFEVFGKEEQDAINELFELNGGVLFAHGFDGVRNGVYRVREFERKFADYFNVNHAQAVSSGSAALKVALKALGIGRGDEVITQAFTFVATVEAILDVGGLPVIVDVDDSLNMDPERLKAAITSKTKAVIPVHMMGAPADMNAVLSIAEKHGLMVLEDNAQCCGGSHGGKALGTIGQIGITSFDANKTIITGEGGMVTTSDEKLYLKARLYHDHGHEYSRTLGRGEENALMTGFNYRMTELQAAIGIVQLSKLEMILKKQRQNKNRLLERLDLPFQFRKIHDRKGEMGDAVIFFCDSREQASEFARKMNGEGLYTKNLPDAIRWHFAKHWRHMFEEYDFYADVHQTQWDRSADWLERAIALPVMVKMDEQSIADVARKINGIAKDLK